MKTRLSTSRKIAQEIPLEIARESDIPKLAATFEAAFKENRLTRHLKRIARKPQNIVNDIFRLDLLRAMNSGVLFMTSPRGEGAALWYLEEKPHGSLAANVRIASKKVHQFRFKDILSLIVFYNRIEQAHLVRMKRIGI